MAIAAAAVRFNELLPQKKADDDELLALDHNDIIQYEILPRLPAKSICRFKCVSRQWKLFISSHMLGNTHRLRHINNKTYKLLLLDKPRVDCCEPLNHGLVTVGFNHLKEADPRFDLVLASLDGLVCVASTKTIASLALWNPLMGAYYKLPSDRPDLFSAYDPRGHIIGFYSDSSNDYKLLYLVDKGSCGAYIYSQRSNSWRELEFVIEKYVKLYFDHWLQATFCDHSLYFLVERIHNNNHECIICFDVNTEVFRIIQLPPLPSDVIRLHSSLVAMDGCIHFCEAYAVHSIGQGMVKRGNMWKLINGDSWAEVAFFPGVPYGGNMRGLNVCITRNARDSWLAIMEGKNNNSFEIMNMEDFTLIGDSSSSSSWSQRTYSRIIYEETLVSPNPPPP